MNYSIYILVFICVFVTLLLILKKFFFGSKMSKGSDIDKVNSFISEGKNDMALLKLKDILAKDKSGTKRAKIHAMIGDCYANMEEYSFAIVEYRHAIDDGYNTPETILSLARALDKIDRKEEALAQYLTLLKEDDYKLIVDIEIGTIYYKNRQYDTAIKYFSDAIDIQPNNSEALKYKGFCFVNIGNYNEAISIMNNVYKKMPDDPMLNYNLGRAYKGREDYKTAIRYYSVSYKDKEYAVKSLYEMGLCYLKLENIESAIKTLEKAINYESYDKDLNLSILYTLSECYDMVGNINKSMEILEGIIVIDPNYRDANEKLNNYKDSRYSENIKKFFKLEGDDFINMALKITASIGLIPYSLKTTDKKYLIVFAKESNSLHSPKKIIYFRTSYSPIFNDELVHLYEYAVNANISNAVLITCAMVSPDAIRYAAMSRIDIVGIKRLENLLEKAALTNLPVGVTRTEEKLNWVL
ncbi:tetratricopeptide repeat protein [Brachyspira innocens]|uniref:Tetratricopeptide repeat protein n=1 Tax=Brachyspira innocens TaxID=13264 RepID=A0ABT8YW68_9SPIR|nr:tetratricopeptide repeat protein [Brachyspira innocens]MDO6993806.1 tetratricopeptide repeat protein [Brachyspira innocens]MDO7020153.1 tetratricopeptide repeat protein [Brachyspira innocens]